MSNQNHGPRSKRFWTRFYKYKYTTRLRVHKCQCPMWFYDNLYFKQHPILIRP